MVESHDLGSAEVSLKSDGDKKLPLEATKEGGLFKESDLEPPAPLDDDKVDEELLEAAMSKNGEFVASLQILSNTAEKLSIDLMLMSKSYQNLVAEIVKRQQEWEAIKAAQSKSE